MGELTRIFSLALIGTMFLIITLAIFSDLDSTYQPVKDAEFQDAFNSINDSAFIIQESAEADAFEFADNIENISQATNVLPEQSLIKGAGKAVRILWRLPNLSFEILKSIANYIGIPTWFTGMVLSIIIVTIGALIVSLFFNRRSL